MDKKQMIRILLEILGGIVFSIILCGVLIFIGYYHANSNQLTEYTVEVLSFPIYKIVFRNGELIGTALNQNMSIIGILCSIITILVVEVKCYITGKKKQEEKRRNNNFKGE